MQSQSCYCTCQRPTKIHFNSSESWPSIAVELRLEGPDLGEAEVLCLVVVELRQRRLELGQVQAANRER